jgi:hypothetical protein
MSEYNFESALLDASIQSRIETLSVYQKRVLFRLLTEGKDEVRYTTFRALERIGFVYRLEWPEAKYYRDVSLTAEGIIAALRMLAPDYHDFTLFYILRRERIVREDARHVLQAVQE